MTTATRERIPEQRLASAERLARHELALKVHHATGNGDILVNCLVEFVNRDIPDARASHIHSAAVELAVMGGYLPEDYSGASSRLHRDATAAATEDNPKPKKPKVTLKQILNKPIGAYIRETTQDGGMLIDFLAQLVDPPPNPDIFSKEEVLPTDRLNAAKELLRRGYGSRNPDYYHRTSAAEEKAINSKFADISRACADGIELTRYLLEEVIRNPRRDRYNQPLRNTYTFSQRIWATKYLLWRAFDIPWEHITPEAIDAYFRAKYAKERSDEERRAQDAAARKEVAKLTHEEKASVMAMFDDLQRQSDEADTKAAADAAKKKAKKAEKKARADKNATSNKMNAANPKDTGDTDANADAPVAKDTDATADKDTDADATTSASDRGATAVANALARHPEVDLDTALQNHHSTAGIPKQNLTHEQIYDAITAEANFQKRQAKFKNLPPFDGAADGDPPKSRSP